MWALLLLAAAGRAAAPQRAAEAPRRAAENPATEVAGADPTVRAENATGERPRKGALLSRIVVANLTSGDPRVWGNAIYPDELPSWTAFSASAGRLSRECDVRNSAADCGTELVCRNSVCAPCMSDSECQEKHRCQVEIDGRNICVPRDLSKHFSPADAWLTVMVFLCTVLSAASGVGGGGMFVPLFMLFLDFTPTDAVPLSQCLIVFSSMVNLLFFVFQRHPESDKKPKIDWELVMLLEPGLACGVVVGVMLNRVSPRWLVTALLLLTLGISFMRSATKGLQLWRKETEGGCQQAKKDRSYCDVDIDLGAIDLLRHHRVPILVVTVIWLCTFLSNFHNVKTCSWQFAIYLSVFFVAMAGITYGSGRYLQIKAQPKQGPDSPRNQPGPASVEWTGRTVLVYPAVATVAGVLGGMLGLGGGIVMAPFLVELNLHPEVIQASTALFVFISSSLASLQFAINNQIMPEYVAWYGATAVVATLLGQTIVNAWIRRSGRSSIIVMCIACVLLVSAVMMTYLGISGTIADIDRGAYMGLDFYSLCLQ